MVTGPFLPGCILLSPAFTQTCTWAVSLWGARLSESRTWGYSEWTAVGW